MELFSRKLRNLYHHHEISHRTCSYGRHKCPVMNPKIAVKFKFVSGPSDKNLIKMLPKYSNPSLPVFCRIKALEIFACMFRDSRWCIFTTIIQDWNDWLDIEVLQKMHRIIIEDENTLAENENKKLKIRSISRNLSILEASQSRNIYLWRMNAAYLYPRDN